MTPYIIGAALSVPLFISDAKTGKIPNTINLIGLAAGLVYALISGTIPERLLVSAFCFAGGFLLWMLGGIGGGDVKSLAAYGMIYGTSCLPFIFWACLFGIGLGMYSAYRQYGLEGVFLLRSLKINVIMGPAFMVASLLLLAQNALLVG